LLASFGPAIQLRGYDLDTTQLRASHALTITLAWQGAARPEHDYSLFVHVIDARGQKVAQVDVPPGGPRWPTSQWDRGRYISTIQRIPLAADLPAGSYHIAIGLYNPDGFQRLPLAAPPGTPDPGAGPDALYLADFTLP
jgi:hypothetical protein